MAKDIRHAEGDAQRKRLCARLGVDLCRSFDVEGSLNSLPMMALPQGRDEQVDFQLLEAQAEALQVGETMRLRAHQSFEDVVLDFRVGFYLERDEAGGSFARQIPLKSVLIDEAEVEAEMRECTTCLAQEYEERAFHEQIWLAR